MITVFYGETGGTFSLPTRANAVSGYIKLISKEHIVYTISGTVTSGELIIRKRDVCYYPVGLYTVLSIGIDTEGLSYISESDAARIDYRLVGR